MGYSKMKFRKEKFCLNFILLVLPFCIVTLLASIKKSTYFMPIKMRLCFIDLNDWFKICFIPISAIIFVCINKKNILILLFFYLIDNNNGNDIFSKTTS